MIEVVSKKLVSIITPSYNSEAYIAETIRSVLAQTHREWEMLIVDDGSTDNTVKVIQEFEDNRIRLFENDSNLGAALSRNLGIKHAKGRWVAFLDSDDLWYPTKLEKQITFMEENNYYFTYTEYIVLKENNEELKVSGPKRITKRKMVQCNWLGCSTVMVDKSVIGEIHIPDLKKRNDYAMWLKAIRLSDCYLLPEVLGNYRKHMNSISNVSGFELLRYQYWLYRKSENKSVVASSICAIRNACWTFYKRMKYYEARVS